MKRLSSLKLQAGEFIPGDLEDGVLYVSEKYGTAAHLCCCGCKRKVVTPLKPGGWKLSVRQGRPTLIPSVGNWAFPCQSHYWIRDGRVEWAAQFSQEEIDAVRERDRRDRQHHYEAMRQQQTWWRRALQRILSWLGW